MKDRWLLSFMTMVLGLTIHAFAAQAATSDRVQHFDLGVGVAGGLNDGASNAAFISVSTSYGITPYLALGVEGGWQEADGKASDETVGYVPILMDIIVRAPNVHESLVPYGILGLGVEGVYVTDSNGDGSNNGADSYETGFAWKLGAGVDWFIETNWIFNFEVAFLDANVNLPLTSLGSNAGFWTVGVALKYIF